VCVKLNIIVMEVKEMGTTKMHKRRVRLSLGSLLALLAAALMASPAGATTLGGALAFSALSTGGSVFINNVAKVGTNNLGSVGGDLDVTLGNNSFAGDEAIATDTVTIGNFSKVRGECVTNGGAGSIVTGLPVESFPFPKHCGSASESGPLTDLTDGINDAATFEAALTGYTGPITPHAPITLASNGTTTITGVAGLNVVQISGSGNVTLGSNSKLTLSGPAGAEIVLWIPGSLSIGDGAKILVSGISNFDVVIYVGGAVGSWLNSTSVTATLLAPNSPCAVGSGAKVDGAVICGDDVTFKENATLLYDPSEVDIPPPGPPPPLTLGEAQDFLILSTQDNTSLGHLNLANTAFADAGDIGGVTDSIGNGSTIQGDVVASSATNPAITMTQTIVDGRCLTSPAGQVKFLPPGISKCKLGFIDVDNKVALLTSAAGDLATFSAEAGSLPIDTSYPGGVTVPANATHSNLTNVPAQPFDCVPAQPVTVIDTSFIQLGSSSSLVINDNGNCTGTQVLVINVTGPGPTPSSPLLNLAAGFKVTIDHGFPANQVVFNLEGPATAALFGGNSSVFNGIVVAPTQGCTVGTTNVKFNGQLVCGGPVTTGSGVTSTYLQLQPFTP
jgi:hypothetical protein